VVTSEAQEGERPESPIDAETRSRALALKVEAARVVDGLLSGMHKSPHRGASVVFVEHREYRPGDDPRLLDWRAFARSDRHTIKRFEQESQLGCTLVLDASGSMDYAARFGGGKTKLEHAATLLAAVSAILRAQGDAVGVVRFDHEVTAELRPRSHPSHDERVLAELARPPRQGPEGKPSALAEGLERVVEQRARRGLVVLASDLLVLDAPSEPLALLDRLRARGHEVWVLHVLTKDELELPDPDAARFVGCEHEPSLVADPVQLRTSYLAQMEAFLEDRRSRAALSGARYALARTDAPAHETLGQLILSRGGSRWA
jgi:uncharacterized protein (DUF58 family)